MNLAKPGQNEKTLKTYLEEEGMIKLLYKIYELTN
jgi:hypothetical protein